MLDPRPVTETAAKLGIRYRLNLLAAEPVAAAKHHSVDVMLAAVNVGRAWPDVLAAEGVSLRVID